MRRKRSKDPFKRQVLGVYKPPPLTPEEQRHRWGSLDLMGVGTVEGCLCCGIIRNGMSGATCPLAGCVSEGEK